MQLLRQAGYGGQVVPVNPKGGTIFGYESVTSIAAIDPPVDLAVIVIRPDAILDAAWPTRGRTGSPMPTTW
jgi:acyl-CoA synthetase (NDP forming)